ncbi:transcriptional regulator [Burkholderia sp. Nafp2/4-1b]|uniref:BRO-N domain-containing protein n=1 Tax=Burkholderia sp. Nafp2/4-1b TaxID=2116686 RepID=UPI000EF8EECB|nr:Bro-N domain-containing protein [Burkholderia sp. Nafp2/4-1b]RKU01806.1 transcriptional regulator [Burkholderia sp. Nafp2/4-1b]
MRHPASSAVLVFESVEFDVVDIRNVPWLRGKQIADALGYSDAPVAISKLYDRNADEFTDAMTQVVELDTAGGRQPVRIFSPRGCYLLGMLARTDRAKAFRAWVLDVLEGRLVPQQTGRLTVSQRLAALRYRGSLARDLSRVTERGLALELYANLQHVSRLLGMPVCALETVAPALKQQSLVA